MGESRESEVFVSHCWDEISPEFSVSGRVLCIQASGVWDSVAFLRRCETRTLGKARVLKWPRDCPDRLLSRAGLTLLAGHPTLFQSDSLGHKSLPFSATDSEPALNCAAHSGFEIRSFS